jgi:hypothetical protein
MPLRVSANRITRGRFVWRISRNVNTARTASKQTAPAPTHPHIGAKANFPTDPVGIDPRCHFSFTNPVAGDITMKLTRLAATSTLAATLLAAGAAFAGGPFNAEYYPFQDLKITRAADKTGNKVVSTKDEATTKKMGAATAGTSIDQYREILMYLKAGG